MTKTTVRRQIKQDRMTTRGMRWKFEYGRIVYIVHGTKEDAVNKLCEMLNVKDEPKKKRRKKKDFS
jgi:hypothetical protein